MQVQFAVPCLYKAFERQACPSQDNMDREVDSYLRRKYESSIRDIEVVHKEDLDLVGCLRKI